jgi:hypothetical protein
MQAEIKALGGCRFFISLLLTMVFIIATVGCGSSYLKGHQSNLYGPNGPKYRVVEWKIEHNLFNSKYQRVEQEDAEENFSG